MVALKIDVTGLANLVIPKLEQLKNPETLLLPVCLTVIDAMKLRIHRDGLDTLEEPIGEYSKGYMAVRTGIFKSNGVYKSGKNKGKPKSKGVFSKGKNKGQPRPVYNRTSDKKIVVSLTSRLENDWAVTPTPEGYGIAFHNSFSLEKARFVEIVKRHEIFTLTKTEEKLAQDRLNEIVTDIFK